jgi:hypothetical protein
MGLGFIEIDLPKARNPLVQFTEPKFGEEPSKRMATFRLPFEGNLGAGQQTHGHIGFADLRVSRGRERGFHRIVSKYFAGS